MKLYFVRHAESEANVLHIISNRGMVYGLTDHGKQQAAALASEMRDKRIRKIYSSRMLRAMQTAEIVAQAVGAPIEYCDSLRDFDCGIAEGRGDPAAWAMHNTVMREWLEKKNYAARIEQGESFDDLRNRFMPLVDKFIQGTDPDDNILVVTHGAISICILPLILKNIDPAFALAHSRNRPTNARYALAETTPEGLMCRSWFGVPIETFGGALHLRKGEPIWLAFFSDGYLRRNNTTITPKNRATKSNASSAIRNGDTMGWDCVSGCGIGRRVGTATCAIVVGASVAVGGTRVAVGVGAEVTVRVGGATVADSVAPLAKGWRAAGVATCDFGALSSVTVVAVESDTPFPDARVAMGGTAAGAAGNGVDCDDAAAEAFAALGAAVGTASNATGFVGVGCGASAIEVASSSCFAAAGANAGADATDAPPNGVNKSIPMTAINNNVAATVAKLAKPKANDG